MSDWISVEDGMPECDALLWCGWCITGKHIGDSRFMTEDGTSPIFMVTHWMPLPAPPE